MKRSILTTHVGSLIRPAELREFLSAKEAGRPFDQDAYAACLKNAVAGVVRKQAKIGIDVVSDGEFGKAISWAQYPLFRLGGFERRPFSAGGFAQVTYFARVHPSIMWAKLESLVAGARLATVELW